MTEIQPSLFDEGELPRFVTASDCIAEIERELNMRRMLYPQWIAAKRLSPSDANRQIARMEAALVLLQSLDPAATVRVQQ